MSEPPILFDTELLARRRRRAARAPADFLHETVAAEVAERLTEVNRGFTAPAVISPRPDPWLAALAGAGVSNAEVVADAPVLALEEGARDLLVHGLALHWANDPVGVLVQARRALRPDGLFIGALFGGATLFELRQALAAAEIEVLGGLSPRVAPMGELSDLGSLLQRAGFALPVADARRIEVSYATALHLMRDLRAMGETNVLRDRHRRPVPRALMLRAAAIYAERFPAGNGRVRASFEIAFLTGWAPGPGQQQPLRPGSARMRLADALGAREGPAGVEPGG